MVNEKPIIPIKNSKDLASYCCFNNKDVISPLSWQFTMWCHLISHFLILSRKPIGTALESSCWKARTDITGLVLILMISDQCTYTCLHHSTPFYAYISHILTFVRFPDLLWLESGISGYIGPCYVKIQSNEKYYARKKNSSLSPWCWHIEQNLNCPIGRVQIKLS